MCSPKMKTKWLMLRRSFYKSWKSHTKEYWLAEMTPQEKNQFGREWKIFFSPILKSCKTPIVWKQWGTFLFSEGTNDQHQNSIRFNPVLPSEMSSVRAELNGLCRARKTNTPINLSIQDTLGLSFRCFS